MFRKVSILALAIALIFTAHTAFAELAAVGDVNPANGFPSFYQDSNGLAVEIGLDPVLNLFDPPIEGNNFSQQIGFGAEGFYWIAEAAMDGQGIDAFYRAALEYAWVNEEPNPGDQFVFARIRIRIDVPVAGTYTVTHPYGTDAFEVETPGPRAINFTEDIGTAAPDFTGALSGRVGPFITAVDPLPPLGFVGNGALGLTHTVSGSPFGTNFLRVQGPGGIDVQTDQFMLSGKIFSGVTGTPIIVDRINYQRNAEGDVDAFAKSVSTAQVTVNGLGPAATMIGDGLGKFFRRIHLQDASALPAVVTITADNSATNPLNSPTSVIKNLVDKVDIARADYDVNTKVLTIEAVSSDEVAPLPTLTATGLGTLVNGSLVVENVIVPPATVTVTSSKGGSHTHEVSVLGIPIVVNAPPVAANDTLTALTNAATPVNVVANDTDIDGTINPLSVAIVDNPLNGIATNNGDGTVTYTSNPVFTGADSFTYTVQDDGGITSNIATVTVTVISPPPPNAAPVANNDVANTAFNTPVTINVIANDTDAEGNLTINPASVVIVTAPLNGTAVSNGDGTVTYTPNAGFSGADSFTYTVRDNALALSNEATVNITVAALPPEVITVTTSLFRRIGARWIISGTDTIPGSVLTIRIEGGALLGTANVSALGIWSFTARNSTIIPAPGDRLRIDSSNGAVLRNVPITIRD